MGRVRKLTKSADSHVANSLNRLEKRIFLFLGQHAHGTSCEVCHRETVL
ncbi:hypothetical protein ACCUM_3768 [Candidatus Accumulibacter phosphatis]|uniref:Uncharacterized protein n=1 Tax=Candidatus Accumulibacter phosphatis TaxID=327160 RepID=A0A5S4EH77_9PROT|nr:hypothetical protein ACCUM_3768 [Candidatus Accumulibacter phosphatis]